jgi:hypothetical protein
MSPLRRAAVVTAAWGAWLTVLAVVLVVWSPGRYVQWPLLAGAGVATFAIAATAGRREAPSGPVWLVPRSSAATILLVVGVTAMLDGVFLGVWLVYIGGGLTALALGGIVRELRAQRDARREVGL